MSATVDFVCQAFIFARRLDKLLLLGPVLKEQRQHAHALREVTVVCGVHGALGGGISHLAWITRRDRKARDARWRLPRGVLHFGPSWGVRYQGLARMGYER